MDCIGRYELIRELGHGAMGRVFLARDPSLERQVALKLLASVSESARQRFHEEAKVLAALTHPGIVTIFEVSKHDGQDFIAMEYLAGQTLREVLTANTAKRDELLAMCAKVATAVAAAHKAGILHRDIKPENIVVTDRGDVKVVDFGIARRMNADSRTSFPTPVGMRVEELVEAFATTRAVIPGNLDSTLTPGTQTVFGTPAYMAPEILIGGVSVEASDVYSLGVTIYECLSGRRPYEQPSLVELMAVVIEGSERPKRLEDPLADLVERMLAREPTARPTLTEVAAALATKPVVRRRRWPLVAGAAAVLATAGAWFALHGRSHAKAPVTAEGVIVVEPITVAAPDLIVGTGTDFALGNAIAAVAAGVSGLKIVGPDELFGALKLARVRAGMDTGTLSAAQRVSAETTLGAQIVVRGTVDHDAKRVRVHLEIVRAADKTPVAVIDRDAPIEQLALLTVDLGEQVAKASKPDASLARGSDTRLARELTMRGIQNLKDDSFVEAQLYLEQALVADPKLFEAWDTLALVLEWRFAPEDTVTDAIDHALALAPDDRTRQLLRGVAAFLHGDYRAARDLLTPLAEHESELDDRQKHDLLYYLGETYWHLGHQKQGVDYFNRVIDLDPRFSPATIHPSDYALSHRLGTTSQLLSVAMGSQHHESTDFAMGKYEAVAKSKAPEWSMPAQIVLGLPVTETPKMSPINEAAYRLATALDAGDRALARRALDALWQDIDRSDHTLQPSEFFELQIVGEVLLCGNMLDDTKKLIALLAKAHETQHTVSGYPRLQLLAAPLLKDKSLLTHEFFSDRTTTLGDAMTAELAGKRARAVTLLQQIVGDPGPFWDYPERSALLRNLRALGRTKEADALCADTLKPAVFRYAFMPLRAQCRKPGRTSGTAKGKGKR